MHDNVLGTLEKKWIREGCSTLQKFIHSQWNCLAYQPARHDQYNTHCCPLYSSIKHPEDSKQSTSETAS